MSLPSPAHVLLVANRTAVSRTLLSAVQARSEAGFATFHLVVPATPRGMHRVVDPEVAGRDEAERQLALALPLLERSGGERCHR